ncbi:MAG: haloalkane dehalogenase [Pseudomonadota bacterium]
MSSTIEALRTPDERFANLPGWSFTPHYVDDLPGYEGLRMHYIDEGPADAAATFVCLHGEPSWSYLYRKMTPVFLKAGARVIAPDLYGFGRSDKPVDDATYTFEFHRDALICFLERMDLTNVCLAVQDWGGILGLTLPMAFPDRITRLLVMNTGLGVGISPGQGFLDWKAHNAANPDLDIVGLMKRSTPILSDEEAAAYAAPFPDQSYKAGVRRFPELVPITPEMDGVQISKQAALFLSEEWSGDAFMAIGMQDPVLGPPAMHALAKLIRNCPEPVEIADAGHFVQEWGGPVAKAALEHFKLG